jgi:hypothetical protein
MASADMTSLDLETRSTDAPSVPLRPQVAQRLTLHLGVLVQPYRSPNKKVTGVTTGDVAEWLEGRYRIMEAFYRVHRADVEKAIENSLGGAMESLLMGRAVDPWGSAMQTIQQEFRDFISSKEAESVGIPNTPTHAALMGYSHRRKHPYAREPRRPSFRDTGLYMASFRSWVD